MNTHAIIAVTIDGKRFELGRFGTLPKAIALARRLQDEVGDEYARFELVELDPDVEFKDALRRVS